VLRQAASRLRRTLRDSDTLARVGGDEFVAVLPGTFNDAQIKLVTGRLLAALQSPFEIEGHTIYLGASIGVVDLPAACRGRSAPAGAGRCRHGRAKETGKGRSLVYTCAKAARRSTTSRSRRRCSSAVREGEFLLYYQPIVSSARARSKASRP
jgi:predicted signal transduction protein with EAL and GGDEF domain